MHNKEIKTCETTGTSHTLRHKDLIATHITRKIAKDIQRSQTQHYNKRKPNMLSIQQDPKYGLRGLQINNPSQLVPRRPKLPPGNPRLLVDVNEEPTFLLGDVLPLKQVIINKERLSTTYSQV